MKRHTIGTFSYAGHYTEGNAPLPLDFHYLIEYLFDAGSDDNYSGAHGDAPSIESINIEILSVGDDDGERRPTKAEAVTLTRWLEDAIAMYTEDGERICDAVIAAH